VGADFIQRNHDHRVYSYLVNEPGKGPGGNGPLSQDLSRLDGYISFHAGLRHQKERHAAFQKGSNVYRCMQSPIINGCAAFHAAYSRTK